MKLLFTLSFIISLGVSAITASPVRLRHSLKQPATIDSSASANTPPLFASSDILKPLYTININYSTSPVTTVNAAPDMASTVFESSDILIPRLTPANFSLKAADADVVPAIQLITPISAASLFDNDILKPAIAFNRSALIADSLKKVNADSIKALSYTQLAQEYLHYDTVASKRQRVIYQNQALNYTMQALHYYSRYNDTTGLRLCFDNLAKVYHAQKKYSQAKWFILQSNTMSRAKNDVPNIITSLIELASIKIDINDYNLAMQDLNEALKLSADNHYAHNQALVQQTYASLYNHMGNFAKAAAALKKRDLIDDSIRRRQESILLAKINAGDSAQVKKKLYTISYRKTYKTNSSKKTTLL